MCKVVLDDRFGWAVERCEERQLGASCSEATGE